MKTILSFIGGALFGALALFLYLRQIGDEPDGALPTGGPPPAAVQPAPATAASNDLPAGLADAQLPIRPYTAGSAAAQGSPEATAPAPAVASPAPGTAATAPAKPAGATGPGTAAPASGSAASPDPAGLSIPVEGVQASQLTDMLDQARGAERHHEALDIMAPRGTRVVATADGTIVKLFESKAGGHTVYQFNPAGTHAYYYAHLDRYAEGLKEGAAVKRGDLIGYVGTSGNADPNAPHLHFAVFALTPEKKWWKGTPVNPYPLLAGAPR
jgi:murein DD-endopeptidase MepM/ murein hydrolase activator NlpD